MTITGGGYVTGLVIHPGRPGLVYARTDVGGVYRWDERFERWTQLLKARGVPAPVKSDYNVASIAVAPSNDRVLYIAAGDLGQFDNIGPGRVLRSSDRGETWSDSGVRWNIRGNGTYRTGCESLAVDPVDENVVYYASEESGLWRSPDAGVSWDQISADQIPAGTPVGVGVRFVLFDPSHGTIDGLTGTIYVGVAGSGVYVSRDAGNSWSLDLPSSLIPLDAKIARDGTLYVSLWTGGGIYRRDPVSETWSNVQPRATTDKYYIGVDPGNSQLILAADNAVRPGFFFRSGDGGATWTSLSYSAVPAGHWLARTAQASWMSVGTFAFDPHVAGQVWFPEGFGVWRTADVTAPEVTWTFLSNGIEEMVTMDAIAPPGGRLITAVADWNGFRHDSLRTPPTETILTTIASAGTSLNFSGGNPQFIAAISSDTNKVNPDMSGYSEDGGQSWTPFAGSRNYPDLYGGNIAVSATNPSILVWLPTQQKSPYVSTDMGATWEIVSLFNGITGLHESIWYGSAKRALDADRVNGQYFYIYSTAGSGAFYRSSDYGKTWSETRSAPLSAGGATPGAFNQIHAVPDHAGHVWASTLNGLFHTKDYGDTWVQVNGVESAQGFGFGRAIGDYPTIFLYATVGGTKGLWRSTDRGVSWTLLAEDPLGYYTVVNVVAGDLNIPGRVYIGFAGNSFLYGDDREVLG